MAVRAKFIQFFIIITNMLLLHAAYVVNELF